MVRFALKLFLALVSINGMAQGSFAPQAGLPGSDAIPSDSSCFRDWAISCAVERGPMNIANSNSENTSAGAAVYATGSPDAPLIVSLGDGGSATLQFSASFFDGPGPDFAVFENGFGSGEESFLELAFVEVSSDGANFFRFPAVSEVQDSVQVSSFENTDARYLKNLAGKYIVNFGVPFDLSELPDTSLLDKSSVSHVRIIDVVGSIDSANARYDANGSKINDPWPTEFAEGGFDLDAVGIIHSNIPLNVEAVRATQPSSRSYYDLLGRPVGDDHQERLRLIVGKDHKGFR